MMFILFTLATRVKPQDTWQAPLFWALLDLHPRFRRLDLLPRRARTVSWSISQFVEDLRRFSKHCDFKATLDDMLRKQIMCGVCNLSVQCKMLAESGLTFKKAFEFVLSSKSADRNATDIQRTVTVAVNKVQKTIRGTFKVHMLPLWW